MIETVFRLKLAQQLYLSELMQEPKPTFQEAGQLLLQTKFQLAMGLPFNVLEGSHTLLSFHPLPSGFLFVDYLVSQGTSPFSGLRLLDYLFNLVYEQGFRGVEAEIYKKHAAIQVLYKRAARKWNHNKQFLFPVEDPTKLKVKVYAEDTQRPRS